ncbi:MAG TPA: nucleoside triphosphate pyrophosphohydrolase [Bacteroidota bacterium]|nr:nucleoside triphosphate pyrophosphohydrolase [Bacteroidota bacterium]
MHQKHRRGTAADAALPVAEFRAFVAIVRRLRKECPWDRKQTHRSLRGSLLEETYETLDALERPGAGELEGELGDILLQVLLHATIAEESGEFTLRDVLRGISDKLVRRHPHVFGTARARSAGHVVANWEAIKMREGRRSVLDGVPRALPALQRALRVQQRASAVGFDWKTRAGALAKVAEEAREASRARLAREREEEFGDLLFALVNAARFAGVDPEGALRGSVDRFSARFRYIERALAGKGLRPRDATLKAMDALWEEAKSRERRRSSLRGALSATKSVLWTTPSWAWQSRAGLLRKKRSQ